MTGINLREHFFRKFLTHIKEDYMKRVAVVFVILFVLSISACAQRGIMGGQQGMMGGGQQPMMDCSMMQKMSGQGEMQGGQQMPMMQTMGQGMMAQDMMQMMMNMISMQEKMMMGVKASEKKKMMKDLKDMKEKMQKMMSMRSSMMGGMMGQSSDVCPCKLDCAEHWLKKAIDLHEVHIEHPKTATEASQMEMMDQMKKAYECITGARCGKSATSSKEPESKETEKEKTPKRDEHGH